jgi:hypothetical protein
MTDSTSVPASGPVPAAPAPHAPVAATPAPAAPAPAPSQASQDQAPQDNVTATGGAASSDATTAILDPNNAATQDAISNAVITPIDATPPVVSTTTSNVGEPATDGATPSLVDSLENAARALREEALGIEAMPGELKDYILKLLDEGSQVAKDFVHHVLDYLKKMSPTTPTSIENGVKHQEAFYRELMNALDNHVGNDFHVMLNCVLGIINWSKNTGGAFASHLWARFLPEWHLGAAEFQKFLNLGQLFRAASDGSTRKMALKQVDLNKALSGLLPTTRERLEKFFRA